MTRIISPHLDDAVLSLGQYMATEPATVITVLAGVPLDGVSDYDQSCGFASSRAAMNERRAEDDKACRSLGATPVHLDFLDRQYQVPRDPAAITEALREWISPTERTFAPLGIGHPDHVLVAKCARDAVPDLGSLVIYEDVPYRCHVPEQVWPALERIRNEGFSVVPFSVDAGDRGMKESAIACYRSQFPDGADDPALLVRERVWLAIR